MKTRQRKTQHMILPVVLVGVGLLATACSSGTPHITLGQTEGHLLSINQMPIGMVVQVQPHQSRSGNDGKFRSNPGCVVFSASLKDGGFPTASVEFSYGDNATVNTTGAGLIGEAINYVPSGQSRFSSAVKKMDGCTRLTYDGSHSQYAIRIHQVSFPTLSGCKFVAYRLSGLPGRSGGMLVIAANGNWAMEITAIALNTTVSISKLQPIAQKAVNDL